MRCLLGVNVDHVATVRQARRTLTPCPVHAAKRAEMAGADNITMHLREDRRHVQESDVRRALGSLAIPLNFEMAVSDEIIDLALELRPAQVCLVPEKRAELTTEGGMNILEKTKKITETVQLLQAQGTKVSVFIEPAVNQVEAAHDVGAHGIELHTGRYANLKNDAQQIELARIRDAAVHATSIGLVVHAGHGLDYHNVERLAAIPEIETLNIGHAIIARSIFTGIEEAVRQMRALLLQARVACG